MKKLVASLTALLALLAFASFSVLSAPVALAGESPNIQICHATGSATNPYVTQAPSKTSIVKGTGHGSDTGDIIPSFTYSEKKDGPLLTYPGKNWTPGNEAIYKNSCTIPLKVVAPVLPTYTPGTCLNPAGTVNLAEQPEGVILNSAPKLDPNKNVWQGSYRPAEGYKFANETAGIFAFTVVGPTTSDPNWDAESNSCELAFGGAGNLTDMLPVAGGVAGAGILFFILSKVRRRQTV